MPRCAYQGTILSMLLGTLAFALTAAAPTRDACLEQCRKRNQYTDCSGPDGGLAPCPCDCPEPNNLVRYFNGAELQVETDDQRAEIERALTDLLKLAPRELKEKRYANYTGKLKQWTLLTLLQKYYVPGSAPDVLGTEAKLYADAQAREAKTVIRKLLKELERRN